MNSSVKKEKNMRVENGALYGPMTNEDLVVMRENPEEFWNGVTEIGNEAFAGSPLTYVAIPGSVNKIGEGAFKNSSELRAVEIYYYKKQREVAENAFEGCPVKRIDLYEGDNLTFPCLPYPEEFNFGGITAKFSHASCDYLYDCGGPIICRVEKEQDKVNSALATTTGTTAYIPNEETKSTVTPEE